MTTNNSCNYSPTQYKVQVGGANGALASVATGTLGQVLTSNGNAANPSFQNSSLATPVTIANGGTNATSMTNTDGVVYFDGTRLVTTTAGTATYVLTSNGAGFAPTYQVGTANSFNQVVVQHFSGNGTYTPTSGMKYCTIECMGGGGAGGGGAATGAATVAVGAGGGGGGYSRLTVTSATIGANKAVTVGAAGTPGAAGNNPGGNGGTTSVGVLITATGGNGGSGSAAGANSLTNGGSGGLGTLGDVVGAGHCGSPGVAFYIAGLGDIQQGGGGGGSMWGQGALAKLGAGNTATGNAAGNGYGGGGGGGESGASGAAVAGGAGAAGYVIITEYVSV